MAVKQFVLAAATLLFACAFGRSLAAQTILPNGQSCQCENCRQLAYQKYVRSTYAERQSIYGAKPSLFERLGGTADGVQPAGHHAGGGSPCPTCYPGGPGAHGPRHGAAAYGPGPHSVGGGTFPYGSQYDHGHPGIPFDGGHYGHFGGAHMTPGYPHHHHHREYVGPQGPPTAQVAYPYYTIRGPRDYFLDNPPSIGR